MITAVDSVTIHVADQDRAKRFYTETLGFTEVIDTTIDVAASARWIELRPQGGGAAVVLILDPDRPSGFGPCIFDTDDIRRTAADLAAHGAEVVDRPVRAPWGGWWGTFKDTEGNLFGMVQTRHEQSVSGPTRAHLAEAPDGWRG